MQLYFNTLGVRLTTYCGICEVYGNTYVILYCNGTVKVKCGRLEGKRGRFEGVESFIHNYAYVNPTAKVGEGCNIGEGA